MFEYEDRSRQDHWKRLRDEYFGERQIIIAANRAPVIFERLPEGELTYSRGAGGLVTALSALAQYLPATWIACARTDADVDWGQGKIQLVTGHEIQVKFLNPSPEAYDGYYNVIANPLLWFIQHTMWDLPRFPVINKKTWTRSLFKPSWMMWKKSVKNLIWNDPLSWVIASMEQ